MKICSTRNLLRIGRNMFCTNIMILGVIFWDICLCKVGISKLSCSEKMVLKTEMLCYVLAHFWAWYGFLLENWSSWKLSHFKSRKFWHKFQAYWSSRTLDMDWLVHVTLFWTDFRNVIISCGFLNNLEIWSKWKFYMTWRYSHWYKIHEFLTNGLWDMHV